MIYNVFGGTLKCHKMRMDKFTDFVLGMNISVKAENDWRSVGRPQVAVRRNCHIFVSL